MSIMYLILGVNGCRGDHFVYNKTEDADTRERCPVAKEICGKKTK